MENLRFRAWDKEDKRMKEVFNIDFHRFTAIVGFRLSEPKSFLSDDPLIIMQSTGLKDKNSVEIYEGDVVKTKYGEIGYIRWFKGSFDFCDIEGQAFYLFSIGAGQPFEIIGNQYEHTHLLEE